MSADDGMTPVDRLADRGVLDWPTLRVGRRHGWVTDHDAVTAAVRHLVEHPEENREDIIALAGADDEPPEVIDELIDRLAGPTSDGEPLNTLLLREAEAHGDEVLDPVEEEPLLRRWLWAHLSELVSVYEPDDVRSRADELWAQLGRPEELRPMSAWSVPEPGRSHDPYATVVDVLQTLDAEIGAIG